MSEFGLKPVFGGGGIGTGNKYGDEDTIEKLYQALKANGCDTIDSARLCKATSFPMAIEPENG